MLLQLTRMHQPLKTATRRHPSHDVVVAAVAVRVAGATAKPAPTPVRSKAVASRLTRTPPPTIARPAAVMMNQPKQHQPSRAVRVPNRRRAMVKPTQLRLPRGAKRRTRLLRRLTVRQLLTRLTPMRPLRAKAGSAVRASVAHVARAERQPALMTKVIAA